MKKKILVLLLISSHLTTQPIYSFKNLVGLSSVYPSPLHKTFNSIYKNPYALGLSATTLLLIGLYARHRFKQLQVPFTNHQDGFCDLCLQEKPDLTTCDHCEKKHFLGIFKYGSTASYCSDCLVDNAFENNDIFRCRFCNKSLLEAVLQYSGRNN